jgi:SAM-dependent methyltransferase
VTASRHLEPVDRLLALADLTIPFAIRACCALGVADRLADGPLGVRELAEATGTRPESLRRVLAPLTACGVFEQVGPDRFGITTQSRLMLSEHPLSLRDAYLPWAPEVMAWSAFEHCLRTGDAAFAHVHRSSYQQYSARHPGEAARMDRVQRSGTRIEAVAVAGLYDWSAVGLVVDVGGGTGAFLAGLLRRFKRMNGVVLDLPEVVSGAGEVLAAAGVAGRCQVVPGDFFESVPPGGDVYVLKSVLGAWNDEDALRLLRSIRSAIPTGGRLLVFEPIMRYGEGFTVGNVIHLQTLVLYGGADRDEGESRTLFARAGFQVTRVLSRPTLPLIEAIPI